VKRTFLIGSVLFTLSGVAAAGPRDYRTGYDDGYNDCIVAGANAPTRADRDYQRGYADGYAACSVPGRVAGWAMLGARSLAEPSEKLMVDASAGRFSQVRIQIIRGAPLIGSIDVELADSSVQTIPVGRRMRPGEVLELALGGDRAIASIIVTGEPDPSATYEVSAR
jgi:hypothetical protein